MGFKELLMREKYVVMHGQSVRFRIIKYLIIIAVAAGVYVWKGGMAVAICFLVAFVAGLTVHFIFRWKTKAWTQSWGPYKKLNLPK